MSTLPPTTILIAEDEPILREGLKCALQVFSDLKVIAQSADGVAAVLDAVAFKPQIILMDVGLPKMDGIKATIQIKEALPGVRIIMFTSADDEETICAALSAGADGYCLKDVAGEHLHSAIKAVIKGVAWLDPGIADRILRMRHRQSEKAVQGVQKPMPSCDEMMSDSQMRILLLLSQGADLDSVAKHLNLSTDRVAELVNAMIAKLGASAVKVTRPEVAAEMPKGCMIADRYSIESVLGRGGMGIVYRAKHLLMDRLVAIKMLHPALIEDELVVRRFQSEAKSLNGLVHPNLVAVFDYGITAKGEPYMVMDYHNGRGLDNILENHSQIDIGMAFNIFSQACDALTAVHEHNMLHRDIKPSNIVISEDGLVKLVDFGIAKSIVKAALNLTPACEIVDTPKYMSPEQCIGGELDARSDIYALGCVMYEVFGGQPPFKADNFYDMVRQHVDVAPSRLPFFQLSEYFSPVLESIVFKALAKEPDQRYQSTAELKIELQAVASLFACPCPV
jgi:DNA-binding NarL/FixJ family response regulator